MPNSGFPSPETVSILLVLTTILHVLGLASTSFRLWFRYHTRRLWWDDFWAALALVCDAVCTVVMWMFNAPLDDPYMNFEALPTPAQSRRVHIISTWLSMIFYTCVIWFARISIVSSVVRIVPPARSVSMTVFGAGGGFFCMWAYLLACKAIVCSMDKSWYDVTLIQCPIPEWVALSEVCTDVLSDVVLVLISVRLLWRVKLPSNQRIMVLSVFSTSILVSVVSALHTIYTIVRAFFIGGITAEMEGAISLIVCNLLVIVTFIYRIVRNGRDLTAGLSDKNAGMPDRLTPIDPNFIGSSLFTTPGAGIESGPTGTNISSNLIASRSDRDTIFAPSSHLGSSFQTNPSLPLASVAETR